MLLQEELTCRASLTLSILNCRMMLKFIRIEVEERDVPGKPGYVCLLCMQERSVRFARLKEWCRFRFTSWKFHRVKMFAESNFFTSWINCFKRISVTAITKLMFLC